ncbi:MAG: TcpQ domain-containing protein [Alphaproteobacteria bacterium]
MKPLTKNINSSLVFACSALAILSLSSVSHAGFEWVPPQNSSSAIVIEQAPVEPVIDEPLNAPASMVPASNSGIDVPVNKPAQIKTLDLTQSNTSAEIMLPPPVSKQEGQEAKAITVQELESSEKTVEITDDGKVQNTNQAITVPQNAPLALVPQNTQSADPVTHDTDAPATSGRTMIKPFPILKKDQPQQAFVPTEPMKTQAPAVQAAPMQSQEPLQSDKEIALGFGKNMPLALALKQILPDNYAYAFSAGVNPGQLVSWNGGKSWDLVLKEALAPLNLDMYYQNKKVTIHNAQAPVSEKTSFNQPLSAQNVAGVEPAAGVESPLENSATSLLKENTLPIKRTNIQDPGEQAQTNISSALTSDQNNSSDLYPDANTAKPLWSAQKGASLKDTLYSWSRKTDNIQIIWEASHDYRLDKDFEFMGGTKQAFEYILQSGSDMEANLTARFIENSTAPGDIAMIIVQDSEQAMKENSADQINPEG